MVGNLKLSKQRGLWTEKTCYEQEEGVRRSWGYEDGELTYLYRIAGWRLLNIFFYAFPFSSVGDTIMSTIFPYSVSQGTDISPTKIE